MSNTLVYIDDIPVYVNSSSTVLQACEKIGVIIPRFCYHDLLEIAGNCRMCLVEIERSPKPQAACGLPVLDQIRIYTNTPLVKKAREGVLEFLLLNHPLDCPICDQGGECDLQNQAIKYGNTRSRFYNFKRGVEDKGLGPIIKTVITRCIHCTRCVRFAWDIAGIEDLGTTLRGNHTEIGTYVNKTFNSEVSGNVIDLCPVGALTSKAHAFKTRPWEVKTTHSIDISDSLGSNINIESKRSRLIRIVPRPNKNINQEWLSDKARFIYEGFTSLRLAYPYFSKNKKLYKFTSFRKTQKSLSNLLIHSESFKIVLGRNVDCETLQKSIEFSKKLGGDFEGERPSNILGTLPCYIQSTCDLNSIANVDSCLLLGVNPRAEASLANLRLRSRFKAGLFKVLNLGSWHDLTYPSQSLGLQLLHFYLLLCGKHSYSRLKTKNPLFVYGDTLSQRNDAHSVLTLACNYQALTKKQKNFSFLRLPLGSNSIGKSFFGLSWPCLKNYQEKSCQTIYYYGLESKNYTSSNNDKTIIETTHVKPNLKKCNIVLPQQSVCEKDGSFINYTGFIQKNTSILRFGTKPLLYLENFLKKTNKTGHRYTSVFNSWTSSHLQEISRFSKVKLYTTPLKILIDDIYITDSYSSASLTLAKVSSNLRKIHWNFK